MDTTTALRPLHPAVLHCWTAYEQTYAVESGKGATDAHADKLAATAYRDAIPCITDKESLRDFIACVTHGMVLQIITTTDGTKLLYAANVAVGALRQEPKDATEPKQPESDKTAPGAKLQAA